MKHFYLAVVVVLVLAGVSFATPEDSIDTFLGGESKGSFIQVQILQWAVAFLQTDKKFLSLH